MSVPSTSGSLLPSGVMDVPFHDDSAGSWSASSEDHVCDLDDSSRARSADLDDRLWVVVVGELGASAHDL